MIPIARLDDPRVADYRELSNPDALKRNNLFVAEGRLVVERLLRSPHFQTRSVLVTNAAHSAMQATLEHAAEHIPIFVASQETMNAIAGFNIHRGCLAIAVRPATPLLADVSLDRLSRVVVLERVNNPDNVGGIFRSAAAFGVDLMVLGPASGDPLYRKAVRTSMAASLRVPFADAGRWPDALDLLRTQGFRVVALTPTADARALDGMPRDLARVALLLGSEGSGLSGEALAHADDRVRIPMIGPTDSLNVTVAASIAMYHAWGLRPGP